MNRREVFRNRILGNVFLSIITVIVIVFLLEIVILLGMVILGLSGCY